MRICIKINDSTIIPIIIISKIIDQYYNFLSKERLDWFELSDNGNVTDDGVKHLRKLTKLRYLKLSNLQGVKNPTEVLKVLKNNLPGCEIIYDACN